MKRSVFSGLFTAIVAIIILGSCAQQQDPFKPDLRDGTGISSESRTRILSGMATPEDLKALMGNYGKSAKLVVADTSTPNAVITVPKDGRLLVTLRDNNAGWKSEIYMQVGSQITLLFADNRLGPLNTTSEYAYAAGTQVSFFIVTYNPNGEVYTNRADSSMCRIDYYADVPKWVFHFEDNPNGDFDYNDAVIEVQMASDPVVDISQCFNVSVDYLSPYGYTPDNLAIYYIGDSMSYKVRINVVKDNSIFSGNTFVVYAIHEYYGDETCDRWWYPSPPRPASEPQTVSVKKGDPLPGQDTPQSWKNVAFTVGQEVGLTGSYFCPLSVAAGNDQTHVMIVHENSQGQLEMTLFDNPVAGVFDPPPQQ